MIAVGNVLVSEEILTGFFTCDLKACKGMCCVEGDAGAPLEESEIHILEQELEKILPFLSPEGKEVLRKQGAFNIDSDGDFVTPLIQNRQCAYAIDSGEGIISCGIEMAWKEGKTHFRKPVSCHLYPIRITALKEYIALNYHRWNICKPALDCGLKSNNRLYEFLGEALIRKFGEKWFDELKETAEEWIRQKEHSSI